MFQHHGDWIVGHASQRDHHCKKEAESRRVNAHRVLSCLQPPKSGDIHQFQRLRRPKRKCRLNNKQGIEERSCPDQGEEDHQTLKRNQREVQFAAAPHQNHKTLKETADSHHLEITHRHLKQCAAGTEERPVEIAVFNSQAEGIKAPRQRLRRLQTPYA